jgi:hypothetical protein
MVRGVIRLNVLYCSSLMVFNLSYERLYIQTDTARAHLLILR